MKYLLLANLLLFAQLTCLAQTDTVSTKNASFQSMLLVDNNLLAIDKAGKLTVWDLETYQKNFISSDTTAHYTSVAKDQYNQIYIGTDKGSIFNFSLSDFTVTPFLTLKKKVSVSEIFFNSLNQVFLIVPYAVYDPVSDIYWDDFVHLNSGGMVVSKRFLIFFKKTTNKYFTMPHYSFIDSEDRVWMASSFGEFGGSIQLFDTKKRKEIIAEFDSIELGSLHPKSVFQDSKQNIYITSGLQHFTNSGQIYKINNKTASLIYDSQDYLSKTDKGTYTEIFVGPGAYNEREQKIYFATTEGFYRASVPEVGKIRNPELLFTPNLNWNRERLAIGIEMAIKKLTFTKDNKLVFLTSNNGIGVYDGESLIMLD